MGLNLIMIDSDESLSIWWKKVGFGLNAILDRCRVHWTPEDVYAAIKSRQSILIVGERDGEYQGFFVMTVESVYDGKQMRIWAAFNHGERANITDTWPHITNLCEKLGCRRVVMSSPRKGWDRLGRLLGMKPVLTEYEINFR